MTIDAFILVVVVFIAAVIVTSVYSYDRGWHGGRQETIDGVKVFLAEINAVRAASGLPLVPNPFEGETSLDR